LRKVACAVLIIAVLVSSIFLLENVQASTSVIGIITSDTTWTKAGSPYQLTGPTAVGKGVTLTIEPGASVDLGDYYLEVNGTLRAKGTSSENIVISATTKMGTYYNKKVLFSDPSADYNEQTGTGSIIENALLNCISITMNDASPKIANNHFKDTSYNNLLTVNRGSPTITGNDMVFNGNGFKCTTGNGSPIFSDNVLTGKGGSGNWGVMAQGITIKDNVISGLETAIDVYYGPLTVIGNTISNSNIGINTQYGSGTVSGNSITYCGIGILAADTVTNNLIANNGYGIQEAKDTASIHYNNILDNNKGSISISGSHDIDATNNWWGTTDAQAINQSIRDFKNDFNVGTVNFTPFLTGPSSSAPSSSNIPNITPISMPTQTPALTPSISPSPAPTETPINTPTSTPAITSGNFSIESNSTISAFSFNGDTSELSFTVSGENGTSGYVKLQIAKAFMPNAVNAKVYLDGHKLDYSLSSDVDSWFMVFTYHHSFHQVRVNFSAASQQTFLGFPVWIWFFSAVIVIVALAVIGGVMVWVAKKKT
jgi:hypothetical protein